MGFLSVRVRDAQSVVDADVVVFTEPVKSVRLAFMRSIL